jgi:Tol biopolymer transport system component
MTHDTESKRIYALLAHKTRTTLVGGGDRTMSGRSKAQRRHCLSRLLGRGFAVLVLATAIPAALTPTPAHATFPGMNGRIAFESWRDGQQDIYAVDPDGTDLARLTRDSAFDVSPVWSPDGQQILFISDREEDQRFHLYVMNADGSNLRLLSPMIVWGSRPSWAPDGSKIAFAGDQWLDDQCPSACGPNIWTMNADGSNPQRLTYSLDANVDPAWSPDGTRIAFSSSIANVWTLRVMNADGTNEHDLLPSGSKGRDLEPDWSPDGAKIAFTRVFDHPDYWRIYVTNVDGTEVTELTHTNLTDLGPVWSPDGSEIAFTRKVTDNDRSIWTIGPSGETKVKRGQRSQFPSWQPITSIPCDGYPASIVGTEGDDILVGTTGDDVIVGLGGNDTIQGLEGNDRICGDSGNDKLFGNTQDGGVPNALESNILEGGANNDKLYPSGNDSVTGGDGNDTLFVSDSLPVDLTLDGGPNNDEIDLHGSATPSMVNLTDGIATVGDRTFTLISIGSASGTPMADTLIGDDGKNTLAGNNGDDAIQGRGGDDPLSGQAGNDSMDGGSGDDQLKGGTGNDTLNSQDGVSGNDRVDGGSGGNACIVDPGDVVLNCGS